MIHVLGNKQKRQIFIHLGKKTLSLFPASTSFQTPLLPPSWSPLPLLSPQVTLSPFGEWCRKCQSIAVCLSCSLLPTLLFHCSFLLICFFRSSMGPPRATVPSGVHLLQHGLIYGPQFLCAGAPPSALALFFPLVPLSSFSLYFCSFLNMFSQRCHQVG